MPSAAAALDRFLSEAVLSRLESIAPDARSDVYVVSLFVYDVNDDPHYPTVTVGFNTEHAVTKAMTGRWPASSIAEARWNYAYFLQNRIGAVIADPQEDAEGRALVEAWLGETGFDTGEAVTTAFVALLVQIVRRLHDRGEVTRMFGRSIPVLIHELEYYDEIAKQNLAANPAGLADDFARWCVEG